MTERTDKEHADELRGDLHRARLGVECAERMLRVAERNPERQTAENLHEVWKAKAAALERAIALLAPPPVERPHCDMHTKHSWHCGMCNRAERETATPPLKTAACRYVEQVSEFLATHSFAINTGAADELADATEAFLKTVEGS